MAFDTKWQGIRPTDILISLLALALILYFIDPAKTLAILLKANPMLVLAGAFFYSLTMLSMGWRLTFILGFVGEKLSLARGFVSNAAGLLASDLTPARSGYFVVPFLLERHDKISLEKGMIAIISPQILDFFLKSVVAVAGIFLILSVQPSLENNALLLFGGAVVMLGFSAAMAVLLFVPKALELAKPLFFFSFAQKIYDFIRTLQANRAKVLPIFPYLFLLSFFNFAVKGAEWYCIGTAIGVQFNTTALHPVLIFMMLQALISAFQFMPVPTIAGLGLAEGGAAASMVLLGVEPTLAVAFLLLTRAVTTLMDCIGVGELATILRKQK